MIFIIPFVIVRSLLRRRRHTITLRNDNHRRVHRFQLIGVFRSLLIENRHSFRSHISTSRRLNYVHMTSNIPVAELPQSQSLQQRPLALAFLIV